MTDFVKKNIFKDLDLDFAPHPVTADVPQKTDAEAVKRAIRNLVLMTRYDKPFKATSVDEVVINRPGMRLTSGCGLNKSGSTPTGTRRIRSYETPMSP